MTKLIALAKKLKKLLKKIITPAAYPTRARRIERVNTKERICAMTFDDGPFALSCSPDLFDGKALTDVLLDTLAQFGAKGTFDVIGDTSENYPDQCGQNGTPAWGGIRYDHYPDYQKDEFGGAVHNDRLIRRMIDEGHQITNHGYRHIIFGKKPFVYGKRTFLPDAESAVKDIEKLHDFLQNKYGYEMIMSRPPHYVDRLAGGFTSKDVYEAAGYLYMAASFDGGGWLPAEDYQREVDAMVQPLKNALQQNPDSLCGQIIFQKDGYNMARRTPIASALPLQLQLLKDYGYTVVTVEELLKHSAFADLPADHPLQKKLAGLAQKRNIVFSDNTVRPDQVMTNVQFALLLHEPEVELKRWKDRQKAALRFCKEKGLLPGNARKNAALTLPLTEQASKYFVSAPISAKRRDIFAAVKEL